MCGIGRYCLPDVSRLLLFDETPSGTAEDRRRRNKGAVDSIATSDATLTAATTDASQG